MWTSPNGYAFLGIIMHYVTNTYELGELLIVICYGDIYLYNIEECLIDFCEVIGEHSGVNITASVYKAISELGLKGCVSPINCLMKFLYLFYIHPRFNQLYQIMPQTMTL